MFRNGTHARTAPGGTTSLRERGLTSLRERGWALLQYLYVAVAVCLLVDVHFGSNVGDADVFTGSSFSTYEQAVMLGCGLAFLARRPAGFAVGFRRLAPFGLLLLVAIASAAVSIVPLVALRRAGSLANLMLFAVWFVTVPGAIRGWRLVIAATVAIAFASLAVILVSPASAFDTALNANALRGVFPQKNSLGDAMVVGLLAQSCLLLHRPRLRWRDAAFPALALVMIALSRSLTSLTLATLVIAATLLARTWVLRQRYRSLVLAAGVIGAIVAVLAVVFGHEVLIGLFGKSTDLTGRTAIWDSIRSRTGAIHWWGSGYSTFWRPESAVARGIWRDIGFVTQNAHNGYLETLLELGIVGLAVMVGLAATTLADAARAAYRGRRGVAAWAAIVIAIALIYNGDEASWPFPDMHLFQWMIAFLLCRQAIAASRMAADQAATGSP